MPVIETFGISKEFSYKKERVQALDDVGIKIGEKEIFGLLGPNGAGKTTLINVLSTLILPTKGTANILGFDLLKGTNEIRESIGLCYGGSRFQWDFSPVEILNYYAMLFGIPSSKRREKIQSLIKDLEIENFANKKYYMLSTGMKQKVAIAKSLLNDPQIVFMDEPTIGLDVDIAIDVRNYLRRLVQERGVTMLLTSHNMHEVEVMCKNIALINKGKIIEEGNIKEIKKRLKFPDTIYIQANNQNLDFIKSIKGVGRVSRSELGIFIETHETQKVLDSLLDELRKRKIKLEDIEIRKATLEDAFLKIVGGKSV